MNEYQEFMLAVMDEVDAKVDLDNSVIEYVIEHITENFEYVDEALSWLHEVYCYGADTGTVPWLTYTFDINAWFTEHTDSINDILVDIADSTGDELKIDVRYYGNIETWASWLAVEYVARTLYDIIEATADEMLAEMEAMNTREEVSTL